MLNDILPEFIVNSLNNYDYNHLQEVRLRVGDKPVILYDSKRIILNCFSDNCISSELLKSIILKTSDNSLYSIQNQLKNGYLVTKNGIRIGISGNYCEDNFNIKSIQGLNIRIPHQIFNCSKPIFNTLFNGTDFINTLIISPPGAGKTTYIRDILYQFNSLIYLYNIVIIDDRCEITGLDHNLITYKHADIVSNLEMGRAISLAVKNLNPDIIVTDEITDINDIKEIKRAINLGIKILSTIHASSLEDLNNNNDFKEILTYKLFDKYIVLNKKDNIGTIDSIYDKFLKRCC